ncbi:helix-turn-helix domain-containing protein [Velocimicrobium porci]|uniref:Transcription regulator PadR N-terminal domain-containing protein n=1 Tax=Velocimicrobium porci TaxID=2606634 RepID=A0A6L5XWE6_9FIRM|nr:hypothetical protein [Velocimicrobium porci]MSS63160.1 hypothetical protein [Velocimicrobium porci]
MMKKGIVTKYKINRLDYLILITLDRLNMTDCYRSMTITEIMSENEYALGVRTNVYKRIKKLIELGYIKKGVIDNHADTFYITEVGKKII